MCRKICFILVFVLLGGLAACYEAPVGGGPGATPSVMSALSPTAAATAVPIATATPTATLEPTSTPTETPTPEVAIPGSEIISHYTETIRAEDTKYNIPVTIITDEKMVNANPMMTIDKIYANDNPDFRTRYGETAKEAIAHAVAYAEYQCWQKNDPDKVSQRSGVSFDAYWQMVKEAQNGKRDWSEVEFQTWANDLTTAEYDAIKRTFRPGNPVTIAYVNYYTGATISIINTPLTFGTEFDANRNLAVFIGGFPTATSVGGHVLDINVAVRLSIGLDRLSWKTQGERWVDNQEAHRAGNDHEKTEIFRVLSIPGTPPNGWESTYPSTYTYNETAISILPNDKSELFSQP